MIRKDKLNQEMVKRISAFMLATTLCVSACPMPVMAEESPAVDNSTTIVTNGETDILDEVVEETEAKVTEEEIVVQESEAETVAEETKAEENQEVATISENDLTPPVIEAISFTENGQTVAGNDELHIQITAYDLEEGSEFLPQNVFIDVAYENVSAGTSAKKVNALGNNQYEIVFDFVGSVVGEKAREKCTIPSIRVRDTSGNETIVKVNDFSEEEWTFTLTEALNEEIQIKEITLEKTEVKLTDDVFEDVIDVELKAEGNLEGVSYIRLEYQTEEEKSLYAYCYYKEETQSFKGELGVSYQEAAGTYKLVRVQDTNYIKIPCDIVSEVTVVKANKDVTGPVVEDFYFKHNGKDFENGSTVKSTDTFEMYVKIKDESELKDISVRFNTNYDNVSWDNQLHGTFVKDENQEWEKTEDGYYKAVFDVTKAYPTEWYMTLFELRDIYGNYSLASEDDFSENYLYIERDGECVLPEFTCNVYVEGIGDERIEKEVTTGRITSLKELFPDGMPEAPEKEGRKFVGWYVEAEKEEIITSEDATIIVGKYDNIRIKPIYDKVDVTFVIEYCNEEGEVKRENIEKTVDYTTTYAELTKMVDLAQYKHWNGVTFEEWDSYYFGNEEIADEAVLTDNTYVNASAIYNKNIASIYFGYYDEKGYWQNVNEVLAVEKGTTYKELIEIFEASELGTIKHCEDAGFQNWKYDEWILESLEKEISKYCSLYPKAVYTNENITPEEDSTPGEETSDIKIKDIQVSNKDIVLTDDNRFENFKITISLEGEDVASIKNGALTYIYVQPKDAKDFEGVYSLTTTYNEQKKQIEGTLQVSGNLKADVDYVVTTVYITSENGSFRNILDTYTGDKTAFRVTKKTTDQTAPVVDALEIMINGNKVTGKTFTLKNGDTLTVRANVTDENIVNGYLRIGYLDENGIYSNEAIASGKLYSKSVGLTTTQYDLEGSFTFENFYEGECRIFRFDVYDYNMNQATYTGDDLVALYKSVKAENAGLIGNKETAETLESVSKNIAEVIKKDGTVSAETKKAVENALANGQTIKTEVSVSSVPEASIDSKVKADVQKQANKVFGNDTKVAYLDIDLNILADGVSIGTLNKLEKEVAITIALPEALKGDYVYKVIRTHENADGTTETEVLDTTKNADGTITFKTDRFSTYAIAYSTNIADKDNTGSGGETTSPITGQAGMAVLYLVGATSALGAVVTSKKKRDE